MACDPPSSGIPLLGCCEDEDQLNRLLQVGGCGYTGFQPMVGSSSTLYGSAGVSVTRIIDGLQFDGSWSFPDWDASASHGIQQINMNDFEGGPALGLFRPPGVPPPEDPDFDEATWLDVIGREYTVTRTLMGGFDWLGHMAELVAFADGYDHRSDDKNVVSVNMVNYGIAESSITLLSNPNLSANGLAAYTRTQPFLREAFFGIGTFNGLQSNLLSYAKVKAILTDPYCLIQSRSSQVDFSCETIRGSAGNSLSIKPPNPIDPDYRFNLDNFTKTTATIWTRAGLGTPGCCNFAP